MLSGLVEQFLETLLDHVFGIDLGTRTLVITAIGGLASPMLAMGASVALERLFGFTTDFRLTELNNPHEPLLRKLLAEAPGSYQSSIMVGNLAEPAAEEIAVAEYLMPWWASKRALSPFRISTVSATEGSLTSIFWKRRESALSFSKMPLNSV